MASSSSGNTARVSARSEGQKLEKLSKEIRYDTARNQLLSAIDSKRTDILEAALDKYKRSVKDENDALLKEAEHEMSFLKVRDELRDAMKREDLEALIAFCDRAEANDLSDYKNPLFPDLIDARQMIILLNRRMNAKVPKTLHFDNTIMREVARFVRPPQIVHDVVVATLLLLDEYEGHTRDWNYCRGILMPYKPTSAKGGFRWRVEKFDVTEVHPEMAARAQEIVSQYSLPQVHKVSKGCSSFFVWTKTQLSDVRVRARPADLKRQREILNLIESGDTWVRPHIH